MKVNIIDNDLLSIQEARILAENAYEAQQKLATFPQEKLDEIVETMAQAASSHAKELAVMSAEETDYGKWQDKFIKNRFACEYLPAHLRNMRCHLWFLGDDRRINVPYFISMFLKKL